MPARPTCSGRCRSRSRAGSRPPIASPLGPSAPAALSALEGYLGGEPIDALRQMLGLTHSGAVRLVDRLAAPGSPSAGRGATGARVAVALTPAGERRREAVRTAREAALEDALAVLSADERATLSGAAREAARPG